MPRAPAPRPSAPVRPAPRFPPETALGGSRRLFRWRRNERGPCAATKDDRRRRGLPPVRIRCSWSFERVVVCVSLDRFGAKYPARRDQLLLRLDQEDFL